MSFGKEMDFWIFLFSFLFLKLTFCYTSVVNELSNITDQESALNISSNHPWSSFNATTTEIPNSSNCAYDPKGPLVMCDFLPFEFITCEEPVDLDGNKTQKLEQGYGCVTFGGNGEVELTSVWCEVLPDIECRGDRRFLKKGFPCVKYNGYYFVTTLIYSVLLGFLGVDRFCLGYTGEAVGKLLTLGGVGIWWIADIVLLVTGQITPKDGSSWEPFY